MNAQGTERTGKRLCVGLLAHVDAGKTTLSEAMLYRAGVIRTFGRVDHGDTFLDTDAQERSRGYHDLFQAGRPPAARLHADAA